MGDPQPAFVTMTGWRNTHGLRPAVALDRGWLLLCILVELPRGKFGLRSVASLNLRLKRLT
jgi:hypothetical protein